MDIFKKLVNFVKHVIYSSKFLNMKQPMYREVQKFNQWWLWMILLGIFILNMYVIYTQLMLGVPVGSQPMSDGMFIVYCVFTFGLIALFFVMKLITEIDEKGIRMYFYPFVKKELRWRDIQKAEVIQYGFVGGWGIRMWTPYGTVYNIRGNKGLALELSNGSKFLIGTQQEEVLREFLLAYPEFSGTIPQGHGTK